MTYISFSNTTYKFYFLSYPDKTTRIIIYSFFFHFLPNLLIFSFSSQLANLFIDFRKSLFTHWQPLPHLEVVGPVKHLDELVTAHQRLSVQALERKHFYWSTLSPLLTTCPALAPSPRFLKCVFGSFQAFRRSFMVLGLFQRSVTPHCCK